MPLTPERRAELESIARSSQTRQKGPNEGFLPSVAAPFKTVLGTVGALGDVATELGKGGPDAVSRASEAFQAERDFGAFGTTRALPFDPETGEQLGHADFGKRVLGTGTELGSFAVPGGLVAGGARAVATQGIKGVAKKVGQQSLKQMLKTGAKATGLGAIEGGLGAGGHELAKPDSTLGSVAAQTGLGTAIGGVAGGTLGLGGQIIPKAVSGAVRGTRAAAEIASPVAESAAQSVGRTIQKGIARADELKKIKAMPEPAKRLVQSGFLPEFVDDVNKALPGTRQGFQRMVAVAKSRLKNPRIRTQSKQIPGRAIIDRVNHLVNSRKAISKDIGKIIDSAPTTSVNATQVFSDFLQAAERLGVKFSRTGRVRSTGSVPASDLKMFRLIYNRLRPNRSGEVIRTPKMLHETRQRLFAELNQARRNQQPFSDALDEVIGPLRSQLIDAIEPFAPGYRAAQEGFATVNGPLSDFLRLIQFKGNIENITKKDLRAGEVALRILGNASDRPTSVLEAVEETAKNFGFRAKDDLFDLIRYADFLDDVAPTQTRSLRGQVSRSGTSVGEEAARTAFETGVGSPIFAGRGIIRNIKELGQATVEEQLDLLDDFLRSGAVKQVDNALDFKQVGSFSRFRKPEANYMIASAENPMGTAQSKLKNAKSTKSFSDFMTEVGISHKKQKGVYGGEPEMSFLISIDSPDQRRLIDDWLQSNAPQAENILVIDGKAVRYDPRTKEAFVSDLRTYDGDLALEDGTTDFFSEVDGRKYRLPLYDETIEQSLSVDLFEQIYIK